MDHENSPESRGGTGSGDIRSLLSRISDDLQTIAKDEVQLARIEVVKTLRLAAMEATGILLAGIVALIGLGMLCVAVVPALAPLIEPLWLRLVLMAFVYMLIGGLVAAMLAKRLKRDAKPDLRRATVEAKRTIASVREGLHG